MDKKPKTLKEIAIELLEKYEESETTAIWEYSPNIRLSEEMLKKEVAKYRKMIDKADRKTENSSEKPNNCEHITEDGVTCAKYPACDDCIDNPLNKVKGSERLVKGKDEPQTEREGE